jgi:hypothetical protein
MIPGLLEYNTSYGIMDTADTLSDACRELGNNQSLDQPCDDSLGDASAEADHDLVLVKDIQIIVQQLRGQCGETATCHAYKDVLLRCIDELDSHHALEVLVHEHHLAMQRIAVDALATAAPLNSFASASYQLMVVNRDSVWNNCEVPIPDGLAGKFLVWHLWKVVHFNQARSSRNRSQSFSQVGQLLCTQ